MLELDRVNSSPLILSENNLLRSGIEGLRSSCLGVALLDIDALVTPNTPLFTPREAGRASQMGPRRLRNFTAARVALKILSRQLGLVKTNRPDETIETLGHDAVKPCLAESGIYCSVSHSARFVVVVAHRCPIGVDIEAISGKTLRTRHLFLGPEEQELLSFSDLGPERTITRAWTIKEAATKAFGLQLIETFHEVEIFKIGEKEGSVKYRGRTFPVRHAEGEGQVITLITADTL